MNGFNWLLKRSKKIYDIAVHRFIISTLLSSSFLKIPNIYHKFVAFLHIFWVRLIFISLHGTMINILWFYWRTFWCDDFLNMLQGRLTMLASKKSLKNFILWLLIRKSDSILIFYFPLFRFPNTWLLY